MPDGELTITHPNPPGRTAPRWQLRLLGAVELSDGRGNTLRLPSRAVALLLARLALQPQRQHAREELADLLWPGVSGEVGRNRLRQALSVLRSLVEPPGQAADSVLQADRRAVWLTPGAIHCDALAFQAALRAGERAAAQQWYQGDLLPGYFEDWVLEERRHFAERHAALPESDPVPAPTAPGMPRAEPQARTAAADAHLPQYLTRLVGFEADGAQLAAALREHRLVVLRGPGGAGKTRLAVEVARALALGSAWWPGAAGGVPDPFDVVRFVPLAACTSRAQMLDLLLHLLGQEPGPSRTDAAAQVEQALAGRRVLLVLDNFEQLVEAGRDDIARWLSHLGGLHLLVTSRRALGLDGECEHALAALPLPEPGATLVQQALNPAVALFVERARAARADFHLSERNHEAVVAVVRGLHGLPLAIELAATRVRSLGLAELQRMLTPGSAQGLELLARSGPRGGDDARHASMLRVLQWSWQQLSAAEQSLLALLAVCDGGASLALLVHLAQLPPSAVALRADNLVAASVAYWREGPDGASRFHAFEPMREFVFHESGAEAVAALRAQHARGVAQWAATLGHEPPLRSVTAEWSNLLRAWVSGADPAVPAASPEQALDTALSAQPALIDLPLQPGTLGVLRACTTAAPQHRSASIQALLALHSFHSGLRAEASVHAQAALTAWDAAAPDAADVLRTTALVRLRLGADMAEVQTQLEQALTIARARGQHDLEALALTHLAVVHYRRDADPVANLQRHAQALALWRAHGPRARATAAMTSVAIALGVLHRLPEQLILLSEARAQAEALGQHRLLAFTMSVNGYALADLKRYAEAASLYRECLELDWAQGYWREWFYALWNLPRALAHLRQPEAAARLMGFAGAFYRDRFGVLGREDLPEARRTRRLVAVQMGSAAAAAGWQAGAAATMAEAMQLARAVTAAP
jgi:predicted ATPase